jgi:hypothetical protein
MQNVLYDYHYNSNGRVNTDLYIEAREVRIPWMFSRGRHT